MVLVRHLHTGSHHHDEPDLTVRGVGEGVNNQFHRGLNTDDHGIVERATEDSRFTSTAQGSADPVGEVKRHVPDGGYARRPYSGIIDVPAAVVLNRGKLSFSFRMSEHEQWGVGEILARLQRHDIVEVHCSTGCFHVGGDDVLAFEARNE